MPVISWLLLHRRCRYCHSPISARYPLVELATAVLFVVTALRLGVHLDVGAYLILDASLVALALIDFEHLLLPRSIVYWSLCGIGAWLIVSAAHYGQWHRLLVAALCAFAWFAFFFTLNFASPRSLGFGDVRLSFVLGLALGWLGVGVVFIGFFLSNLIGAVVGLILIAAKKRTREQPVPYGVYLALGTALAIFVGPALMTHWHYWPIAR
jgi:leader peptidase (prepilin peptidase) / N-methyltransferase